MSGVLSGAGLLVAAMAAAAAILLPSGRARAAAMVLAAVLCPLLIVGDQWHTHQIVDLREDGGRLALLLAAGVGIVAVLAAAFHRWRLLMPLAIVAALPFRIPLHAGGDTANLLVPLYLVIAAALAASAFSLFRGPDSATGPAGRHPAGRAPVWLARLLAAIVVLYALQTLYSVDFSKGLQNLCFFLVPFTLVYTLITACDWDRSMLRLAFGLLVVEALAFVVVGGVEYATRSLFWNDQVIRSNDFHTYFRVNSVFWDPNIFGRWLALVIVVATAVLVWARNRRGELLLTGLVAILWIGLVPTFSQSSFLALLGGLAVIAALRWSLRWTAALVAVALVAAGIFVAVAGGSLKIDLNRANADTSGRANLVSGGAHLFAQRPVWGYGSGSFPTAYRQHVKSARVPVSVSHTEPVTVAAEQGLIGLALYIALIATALWTMLVGARSLMPGLRGPPPATGPAGLAAARVAVLAAFVALLVHTMAYAGFFEDPITWVLMAIGAVLATAPGSAPQRRLAGACPATSAA